MIQNLISGILFLKILFRVYNFLYLSTRSVDIIRVFISRFPSRNSQSQLNKNQSKKSLILQPSFAQKTSLILRNLTHLTLKIICSRKKPKALLTLKVFQKTCFCLVSEKKLYCTISCRPGTAFLKHSESKCLYISVCLLSENFCSREVIRFCLVPVDLGEAE